MQKVQSILWARVEDVFHRGQFSCVRKKRPRFLDSQSSLYFADDCPEPVLTNDRSPFKETKEQRNFFQGRAFGKKNKIKKKGKERFCSSYVVRTCDWHFDAHGGHRGVDKHLRPTKNAFFLRCHLYINTIILPRQARDKHRY